MRDWALEFGRAALAGRKVGPAAGFRAVAAGAEPFYSAAMSFRNRAYDRGWFASSDLGRPTVSVGNITTGGTGKTPVVRWLAEKLRSAGHRPAILMRGYAAPAGGDSDERLLLDQSLNGDPSNGPVPVVANPSRINGAAAVLKADPSIDRFILDDGFQHRRARRDFDLVLINATDPFGGDHVLPRGLLREPLHGLRRASAILVTRAGMVEPNLLQETIRRIEHYSPAVPVFRAEHQPCIVRPKAVDALRGQSVLAVSGIGDPASFERQLAAAGATAVEPVRFRDHHVYSTGDVQDLARRAAGRRLVTTEKDWVKILPLLRDDDTAGWFVTGVVVRFVGDDENKLLDLVRAIGSD